MLPESDIGQPNDAAVPASAGSDVVDGTACAKEARTQLSTVYRFRFLYLLQAADGTSQRLAMLLGEAARAGLWRSGGGSALLADMRRGIAHPHQAWPLYEALLKHCSALPPQERKVS